MLTARRRRTTWAVAISALAHLAVLIVVAVQQPMLNTPPEEAGPPVAIIPVLLLPRTAPAAGSKAKPEPIRLHRRPQPFVPPQVPTLPIAPPAPRAAAAPPSPRGPVVLHPAPLPEGPKGDVRAALRHGPVGCANPQAVGLNKAERDLCDEKLGAGIRTATPYDVGTELTAEKRRALDAAAAKREEDYRYKHDQPTATLPPGNPGQSAEDMCKNLGIPPEKCGVHR